MDKLSKILVIVGVILVGVVTNYSIFQKESLIKNGKEIYLKLAPVDPRSLMQGDYMALRFAISRDIYEAVKNQKSSQGLAVLELNSQNIAKFKSIYQNQPLNSNEVLIKYRKNRHRIKLSTDSYFFEEGSAKKFEKAEYGVFRVNPKTGEAILTNLADIYLKKI